MGAPPLRRIAIDSSLIGFVVAALVALSLVAMTQWLAAQQRRAAAWALQSQEVLGVIAATRAALVDIQNGHRGFTIEGTPEALAPYEQGTAALEELSPRLRELLRNAPQQQAQLAAFDRLLPQRLATAARLIEARRSGGMEAAQAILRTGVPAREMADLRRVLEAMERQQEVIFHERAEEQQATMARLSFSSGIVTFLLLPTLGVLYGQNRRRRAAQQGLAASEERFRLLTQSVVDYAIVMLDPSGRVQTWNTGAERILGYPHEEAQGRTLESFYPPEEDAPRRAAADLAEAAGQGSHSAEAWWVRRDGSRFWALAVLNAIVGEHGAVRGFSMVLRDLTERRRIDAEKARVAEQLRSINERLEAEVAQRTQDLRASNLELEQAQRRLQQLSARMVEHQEQERRRLAYELHEDMAQSMSAIRIDLERARSGAAGLQAVEEAIRLLDALITQTREMVRRLRPTMLDDLGLAEALEGELAVQARRHNWKVRLQVEPEDFPHLPPQLATACFRIAQEALANAAWHAQAQEVDVVLRLVGAGLELTVEDNGVGFDLEQHLGAGHEAESFGLVFMRERARQVGGSIGLERGSGGRGVRVRLSVPDRNAH